MYVDVLLGGPRGRDGLGQGVGSRPCLPVLTRAEPESDSFKGIGDLRDLASSKSSSLMTTISRLSKGILYMGPEGQK